MHRGSGTTRTALSGALALLVAAAWSGRAAARAAAPRPDGEDGKAVDFGRDVRPILSDKCFKCHGPDPETREADLRLDLKDEAFRDLGGYTAIVPGKSDESELYMRVTDSIERMPPEDSGKSLTTEEIEILRRWIEEGAPWEEHWSYLPVRRPPAPAVSDESWPRNDIDRFVLARLDAEGLAPEPEAAPETLLRRLSLDLTGLPPTPEELDAFLADRGPGAVDRAVDRLFASPRYGEHMARAWLDEARYGDTHGFHLDNLRIMWPYRDWVIRAFNENMPFDRFTVEQLAGDLLPEPTTEQLVATGFNRCNPTSAEGGMIPEEFLVIYAEDRVVTTSTVWLGTTMLCAQCHDHKFDPIKQRDFYRLFAFFNNIEESASDGNAPSPAPVVQVPSPEQRDALAELDAAIEAKGAELEAPLPEVDAAQARWEAEWAERLRARWQPVEPIAFSAESGAAMRLLDDGSVLVEGESPPKDVYEVLARTPLAGVTALRLEALTDDGLPMHGPGRAENGNFVLSSFEVQSVPVTRPGAFADVPIEAAYASYAQSNYPVAGAIDPDAEKGWGVHRRNDDSEAWFLPAEPFGTDDGNLVRIRMRFESKHAQHEIGRFRLWLSTDETLRDTTPGPWYSLGPFTEESGDQAYDREHGPETGVDLAATYADGALSWTAHPEWADGEIHELAGENCATYVYRTIESPDERTLTLALGSDDAIEVWLNGEVVLEARVARSIAPDQNRVELRLHQGENRLLMKVVNYSGGYAFTTRVVDEVVGGLPIAVARALGESDRTDEERALLRDHYRRNNSPEWKAIADQLESLRAERKTLEDSIPLSLVMKENAEPRPAHVLVRGSYERPAEEVQPGTPSFLPPLPVADGRRASRLDLARWLVDPEQPLTARVTVNRYWQELFGTGLVKTAEDFGSQGEWPSHPGLLDWLASEFVESGWDVQHMLRLMVTSATYRQASTASAEKRARDPENRLLAHGPRFRLDAERIRDQALYLGGLLVEEVGGPSVKPYQPPGIWEAVAYTSSNTAKFMRDSGEALYRRSLYTFWKRTAPPASMQIFDAPDRESCTVRRARTNTPLQALTLMNDEQFVEAARAFAQRVLVEGPATTDERLSFAFRMAAGRRPNEHELSTMRDLLQAELDEYGAAPEAARALLEVGESRTDPELDPVQLAAWTHVTNLLLNLDEVVTKG